MRRVVWILVIVAVFAMIPAMYVGTAGASRAAPESPGRLDWTAVEPADLPALGSLRSARSLYERWKENLGEDGAILEIGLRYDPAESRRESSANGMARIDLRSGAVTVDLDRRGETSALDVWFVGKAMDGDRALGTRSEKLVGSKTSTPTDPADLRFDLAPSFRKFRLNRIVVTEKGKHPRRGALLVGRPDLFQTLYVQELQAEAAHDDTVTFAIDLDRQREGTIDNQLAGSLEAGRNLFLFGTFGGNGRVCATCHPAENNYTLDPEFVQALPASDKLFVAESTSSPLHPNNTPGGHRFEAPKSLMESHALVLANPDGFPAENEADRFVLRGVPHLMGLQVTSDPDLPDDSIPRHRLGWGGDGSPHAACDPEDAETACGELVHFATGAIAQHFTQEYRRCACKVETIGGFQQYVCVPDASGSCRAECQDGNAVPYCDYIVPTDVQREDLKTFLTSLGRDSDPPVATSSVGAGWHIQDDRATEATRFMFGTAYKCAVCHTDAGGNPDGPGQSDLNSDIGIELALQTFFGGFGDALRPPDGGFGTDPSGATGLLAGSFGNGTFDTVSLVEAADTPPYFHNSLDSQTTPGAAGTQYACVPDPQEPIFGAGGAEYGGFKLEDAIRYYATCHFKDSPDSADDYVLCTDTGNETPCWNPGPNGYDEEGNVQNIGRLLRVLNSLDNIHNTIDELVMTARLETMTSCPQDLGPANLAIELAIRNVDDVISVLEDALPVDDPLNPFALKAAKDARLKLQLALGTSFCVARQFRLRDACRELDDAQNHLALLPNDAEQDPLLCCTGDQGQLLDACPSTP
ncbi:MAG: hypothetical protein GY716_04770 [bacterium]|nr:hypothetical protein [bacterium]